MDLVCIGVGYGCVGEEVVYSGGEGVVFGDVFGVYVDGFVCWFGLYCFFGEVVVYVGVVYVVLVGSGFVCVEDE